jgi:hypothetical protein
MEDVNDERDNIADLQPADFGMTARTAIQAKFMARSVE